METTEPEAMPFDGHYRATEDEYRTPDPYAGARWDQESYLDNLDHLTNYDFRAQVESVRQLHMREVNTRSQVEYLGDMTKVILADEIEAARERLEQQGVKDSQITVQRLESEGRRSASYKRHLDLLRQARNEHGVMAANYYAARNTLDAMMASLAVIKGEMYLQGKQ